MHKNKHKAHSVLGRTLRGRPRHWRYAIRERKIDETRIRGNLCIKCKEGLTVLQGSL